MYRLHSYDTKQVCLIPHYKRNETLETAFHSAVSLGAINFHNPERLFTLGYSLRNLLFFYYTLFPSRHLFSSSSSAPTFLSNMEPARYDEVRTGLNYRKSLKDYLFFR
jgi:hypothetical protein